MGAVAGQAVQAGRVPDQLARTTATADVTFTTTETVCMTVTAYLIAGRTYRVRFAGAWNSTATDRIITAIREDSVSGAGLVRRQVHMRISVTAAEGRPDAMETEFVAESSGDKTFVVSAFRNAGAGTCNLEAASTRPCFLAVDYVRG